MVDDVGRQLAGGGFGLDAGDELAAGRAHHLDLHERKALVEGLGDLLLDLGEIGRVVDDLAFLLGRLDQLGRAEVLLRYRHAGASGERSGDDDRAETVRLANDTSMRFTPLFRVSEICYPARPMLVSVPRAPRESKLAMPMTTASSTICTRLNAAVMPTLPPS